MSQKKHIKRGPSEGNFLDRLLEPAFGLGLVGIAESRGGLAYRVKRLISLPIPQSAKLGLLAAMMITVIAGLVLPMARGQRTSQTVGSPELKIQADLQSARAYVKAGTNKLVKNKKAPDQGIVPEYREAAAIYRRAYTNVIGQGEANWLKTNSYLKALVLSEYGWFLYRNPRSGFKDKEQGPLMFLDAVALFPTNANFNAKAALYYFDRFMPESISTNRAANTNLLKSLKFYEAAVKSDPTYAYAYWGLKQIYASLGRQKEAMECNAKFIELFNNVDLELWLYNSQEYENRLRMAQRIAEENSVSGKNFEAPAEKEYTLVQQQILQRIEKLKEKFPPLRAMTNAAHYEYNVKWVLDDPTQPNSKTNGRHAVFGKDGYWFSLTFYRGQWGGQAMFIPIEFGDLKLWFQFGDGGHNEVLTAITTILREENEAFCRKHPEQKLDEGLQKTKKAAALWDENLLAVELGPVLIEARSLPTAWEEIGKKYFLRANLFMDSEAIAEHRARNHQPFAFHREKATGKDVFDAFLETYPAYTYTRSPETGVIWLHPKRVKFENILSEKIRITRPVTRVTMYSDVFVPLCRLLAPKVLEPSGYGETTVGIYSEGSYLIDKKTGEPAISDLFFYSMDLPAGDFSAREILDLCCVANPSKVFRVVQTGSLNNPGSEICNIAPHNLIAPMPHYPVRAQEVKFWDLTIGKASNGIPSLEEVRTALSDSSPVKRSAACLFLEASFGNYVPKTLVENAATPEQAVWTALGLKEAKWKTSTGFFKSWINRYPRLGENLRKVQNPSLALLASLELTREQQDSSYLDDVVVKHQFTQAEIANIQPELDRLARLSKAVRDKLRAMKSQIPGLSPEHMSELEQTNFLTLVPPGVK